MKKVKTVSLRKMQRNLWLLGFIKIPIIGFVRPKLLKINENEVEAIVRFRKRTKNHLNSMYFGALAVGADVAAGIHAFYFAEILGEKVSFAFKGMNAEFLKRAESDVIFSITQGGLIRKAILASKETGERMNQNIDVIAKDDQGEIVATFVMVVSVKVK